MNLFTKYIARDEAMMKYLVLGDDLCARWDELTGECDGDLDLAARYWCWDRRPHHIDHTLKQT